MPTKVKEYSLFSPGKLVQCVSDIYSSSPIDGDGGNRINGGTVGLIITGPSPDLGFKNQYQVQFLNNIVWWVNANEIEPYYEKK